MYFISLYCTLNERFPRKKVDKIKKRCTFGLLTLFTLLLTGCSTVVSNLPNLVDSSEDTLVSTINIGKGTLAIKTPLISEKDNELLISTSDLDENKLTYIYVANQKVLEKKMKNNETYSLNIKNIKNAHLVDHKPKIQLKQFKDDKESEEILTFKQACYIVKDDTDSN